MVLLILALLAPLAAAGGFCPQCALRALGLTDNAFMNNGPDNGISLIYAGDASAFGSSLGKQIAMRIMQGFNGNIGSGLSEQGGGANTMSAYPDTPLVEVQAQSAGSFDPNEFARKFREQYQFGVNTGSATFASNTMPPVFGAPTAPVMTAPNKGKCPYCFGNNGYKKARKAKKTVKA